MDMKAVIFTWVLASATLAGCGSGSDSIESRGAAPSSSSTEDAAAKRARELCSGPGLAFAENYGPAQLVRSYPTSEAGLQRWEDRRFGRPESSSSPQSGATMAICYFTDVLVQKGPPPDSGITAEPYDVLAVVVGADGVADIYSASPRSKRSYETGPPQS